MCRWSEFTEQYGSAAHVSSRQACHRAVGAWGPRTAMKIEADVHELSLLVLLQGPPRLRGVLPHVPVRRLLHLLQARSGGNEARLVPLRVVLQLLDLVGVDDVVLWVDIGQPHREHVEPAARAREEVTDQRARRRANRSVSGVERPQDSPRPEVIHPLGAPVVHPVMRALRGFGCIQLSLRGPSDAPAGRRGGGRLGRDQDGYRGEIGARCGGEIGARFGPRRGAQESVALGHGGLAMPFRPLLLVLLVVYRPIARDPEAIRVVRVGAFERGVVVLVDGQQPGSDPRKEVEWAFLGREKAGRRVDLAPRDCGQGGAISAVVCACCACEDGPSTRA